MKQIIGLLMLGVPIIASVTFVFYDIIHRYGWQPLIISFSIIIWGAIGAWLLLGDE